MRCIKKRPGGFIVRRLQPAFDYSVNFARSDIVPGWNPENRPARKAKLGLRQDLLQLVEFDLLKVAFKGVVDAIPTVRETRWRILRQLGCQFAPASEGLLHEGTLCAVLGGFVDEPHHANALAHYERAR